MKIEKLYFVTFTLHETGGRVKVGCDVVKASSEETATEKMTAFNASKRIDSTDFRVYPLQEMLEKYGFTVVKKEKETGTETTYKPKVPEKKTMKDALSDFDEGEKK